MAMDKNSPRCAPSPMTSDFTLPYLLGMEPRAGHIPYSRQHEQRLSNTINYACSFSKMLAECSLQPNCGSQAFSMPRGKAMGWQVDVFKLLLSPVLPMGR